jgi:small-conductance mechanosensitive channel
MRSPVAILFLLFLVLIGGATGPTSAAAPTPRSTDAGAPPALTTAEAQQLLSMLQNPQKRAQLITTLENLEKIMPMVGATAPAATPAPKTAPGTAVAPAKPAAAHKSAVSLQPNSLGADILSKTDSLLNEVDVTLLTTVTRITDYREFGVWADEVSRDPAILAIVLNATWRLAAVLIVAFICEYLAWHFTRRFYDRLGRQSGVAEAEAKAEVARSVAGSAVVALEAPENQDGATSLDPVMEESAAALVPQTPVAGARPLFARRKPFQSGWLLLKRLPFILLAMVLDAVPPLIFLAAAMLVLSMPITNDILMRLMIGAVVNAYVLCRLLLVVARGAFCAPSPKLRLLHVSNDAAAFLTIWCRRIALVIVLGYAVLQIGNLSGMSIGLQHGLGRIFGLIAHIMLVIMVLKRRKEVEAWLRGQPGKEHSLWYEMKHRVASVWHLQAIIIIMLVWIVYATEVSTGIEHPMHLILLTLGMLILFRVCHIIILGAVDKAFVMGNGQANGRYALIMTRAARYHAPLRVAVRVLILITLCFVLLQIWGVDAFAWFQVGGLGGRLISSLGTIVVTLVVAVIIWETINFAMQLYMDDLSQQGAYVRAARVRTVIPLLRNTLLILLFVVFALTALSEIGVNIGPLLAGASILGVAIGFGSQKLVQDFINGIFLLLENAMQVGDWVTAGGLAGTVENLSIRTLRLRAGDGSVHIIPFSSVTTVTNTNRGLGNASVSVTISYEEDTDAVGEILKQIALDMRAEDAFKDGMLSDLQLWGVDKIDGTTATLAGQIVCTDKGRWGVQREYNRRVKLAFQEHHIRLIPSASIIGFQHPLDIRVEMPEQPARAAESSGS